MDWTGNNRQSPADSQSEYAMVPGRSCSAGQVQGPCGYRHGAPQLPVALAHAPPPCPPQETVMTIVPLTQREFELYALSLPRGPNFGPLVVQSAWKVEGANSIGVVF